MRPAVRNEWPCRSSGNASMQGVKGRGQGPAVQGVDSLSEAKPVGRRPVPRPEDFPHRTVETIRFGDLDRQNHVNNAVFSTFLESGRVIILYGEEYGLIAPGASFVLAHLSIDFLGEMHWPGEVEIGTG